MSGPFKVGDLIECVDAKPSPWWPSIPSGLQVGELYTIRAFKQGRRGVLTAILDRVKVPRGTGGFAVRRFRLVRRPRDHADFLASLTREPAEGLDVPTERRSEVATAMFHGDCLRVIRSLDTD